MTISIRGKRAERLERDFAAQQLNDAIEERVAKLTVEAQKTTIGELNALRLAKMQTGRGWS